MAVCRKARCIKLTIFSAIIVTIIYTLYPDQIKEVLKSFAPPTDSDGLERPVHHHHHEEAERRVDPKKQVVLRERHSESETYLTPGNPGNQAVTISEI